MAHYTILILEGLAVDILDEMATQKETLIMRNPVLLQEMKVIKGIQMGYFTMEIEGYNSSIRDKHHRINLVALDRDWKKGLEVKEDNFNQN